MSQEIAANFDIKVQKRNGQVIEFIPNRITHAVANSFKEQIGLPRESELSDEVMKNAQKVTDCVVAVLKERGIQRPYLTVEEIQDLRHQVLSHYDEFKKETVHKRNRLEDSLRYQLFRR